MDKYTSEMDDQILEILCLEENTIRIEGKALLYKLIELSAMMLLETYDHFIDEEDVSTIKRFLMSINAAEVNFTTRSQDYKSEYHLKNCSWVNETCSSMPETCECYFLTKNAVKVYKIVLKYEKIIKTD